MYQERYFKWGIKGNVLFPVSRVRMYGAITLGAVILPRTLAVHKLALS
jgi:hypothetical protein